MMRGKILIAVIVTVSMGLASLNVYSQKEDAPKKHVERVYEPGDFSKNFNRLPDDAEIDKVLMFDVEGVYKVGATQAKLKDALLVSDLISKYPSRLTTFYSLIEVSDAQETYTRSAVGTSEVLTVEQLALIKSASLEEELRITTNFKAENTITGNVEERKLAIRFTVIPEIEAEYAAGNEELVAYLQEYSNSIIPQEMKNAFEYAYVAFVVNETGGIEDVKMKVSTEYDDIDEQLMEFIETMPEWNPAQNAQGEFVKQRFEFSIRTNIGGC